MIGRVSLVVHTYIYIYIYICIYMSFIGVRLSIKGRILFYWVVVHT